MENEFEKPGRNYWKIITLSIITIAVLAFIGIYGYGLYQSYMTDKLNQAYNSGIIDVVNSIAKTGNIPLLDNSTGTLQVKQISIQQICTGKI